MPEEATLAVATDQTQRLRRERDSETAWHEWFQTVYRRVYYTIYRTTGGDRQQAEDLTQAAIERFLRYRALDKVASDREAVAYLVRTAQRLHADHRRQLAATHAADELSVKLLAEEDVNRPPDPFDLLDLDLLASRLSQADRQLIGFLRDGRSIGDIAGKLGIAYTAAAVRIHRAKARLRATARQM